MSEIKRITTPLSEAVIRDLHAGDTVSISGTIYTARDKAHKRMVDTLAAGEPLPVDLSGQIVYYAGPTPAKPGKPIGSVGPTTSSRMDAFSPTLLDQVGVKGMVGKGPRNDAVIDAMRRNIGVYMVTVGGTGAAIANAVKTAEIVAYDELGTEAIRRLTVENLAAIVAIDCLGNDLFVSGRAQFEEKE